MRVILYNDYPRFVLYCEDGKLWTYESGEINLFALPFKIMQIETASENRAVLIGVEITGEHVVCDIYGVTRTIEFDSFCYTIEYGTKANTGEQAVVMKRTFCVEPYSLEED